MDGWMRDVDGGETDYGGEMKDDGWLDGWRRDGG